MVTSCLAVYIRTSQTDGGCGLAICKHNHLVVNTGTSPHYKTGHTSCSMSMPSMWAHSTKGMIFALGLAVVGKEGQQGNGNEGTKDSSLCSEGQTITITEIRHMLAAVARESWSKTSLSSLSLYLTVSELQKLNHRSEHVTKTPTLGSVHTAPQLNI